MRMKLSCRGSDKLAQSPTRCCLVAIVVVAVLVAHPKKLPSQTGGVHWLSADTVSRKEGQPIWEAVLRYYRARSGPTEADIVRETDSLVGRNRDTTDRDGPSLVLFGTPKPGLATYDSVWLGALVKR